jgi:DNA-binding response OmpR family regulator
MIEPEDDVKNASVCVVADDPSLVQLLAGALGHDGYANIRALQNLGELADSISSESPDLILIDCDSTPLSAQERHLQQLLGA